eukprot:m.15192 g.15192  ORF g.15192 m.15192 type:complete len:486 (+) comp26231_c0_seq1:54-1511(+)
MAEKAVVKLPENTIALLNRTLPKPGPPKKVLEEDDYVESLEKIIQRDFFPDIPKLKAQTEYLEAEETHDWDRLRAISERYSTSRLTPGPQTPSAAFSDIPSTKATPASIMRGRAAAGLGTSAWEVSQTPGQPGQSQKEAKEDHNEGDPTFTKTGRKVGLDQFLSKNTSEDNASFGELMVESAKKHMQKHAWLYVQENELNEKNDKMLAITNGQVARNKGEFEDRTFEIESWKYTPKNSLMYIPDGAEFTVQEKITQKRAEARLIHHSNTRLSGDQLKSLQANSSVAEAAAERQTVEKFGVDGKTESKEAPTVGGYNFLATPALNPGVDSSPMMTWGEIEGTPFRLDGGDVVDAAPGPTFKIPEVPKRDELGHKLSEKVSQKHRAQKRKALETAAASIRATPAKYGSVERLSSLSPAAQKLVNQSQFGRSDKRLQASYSPYVKSRDGGTPARPGRGTPVSTPIASRTPSVSGQSSITDNLLNLKKS